MDEVNIKAYRTKRLDVEIKESKFGDEVIITDRKTGSSKLITPDVGMGLMVDPFCDKELRMTFEFAINKIINK